MDIKNIDNNKKRMILIVSVISLLLLLVIGGTIAFFGWRGEEALVSVTVSSGTGSCVNISDNEVLLYPTADRNNGRIIKLKANQLMGSKAYITWNLVVNKIEGLQNSSFKYELVNSTTGKSYGTGNFANITNTEGSNTITFSNSEEKLDYDTDYEFTLYLWIDGEEFDNPLTMADQEFDFDMSCSITGTSGDTVSLNLGDYISYTPSSTSYTTDTTYTNYTSTQTINPSELNLWRVLNINDDGTVDIISEYVSSTNVYFSGQLGYQNLVGYLNELASQYETEGITVGSRHFGYDGQTEYITDTRYFTSTAPWACSTGDTCSRDPDDYEAYGGGDTGYLTDYNQVKTVLGMVSANEVGTSTPTNYWMASRYYKYYSSTYHSWNGRNVDTSNSSSFNYLWDIYDDTFTEDDNYSALRPIVTLKSGLSYEGLGTEEEPYNVVTS